MSLFFLAAGVLTLAVWAVLLLVVLRGRLALKDNRQGLNAAVYRDQLAELETERMNGSLEESDYLQARDEIQRRLLDEGQGQAEITDRVHGRKLALAVLLLLPLGAGGLYAWRGNWAIFDPQIAHIQSQAENRLQLEAQATQLEQKVAANPNSGSVWAELARIYMALDRPLDARRAFAHLGPRLNQDPQLLVDYAEALVSDGKDQKALLQARDLVDQALRLDPGNPKGLFMAGGLALAAKDYRKAARVWEKLLPLLEPGSQDANFVLENLNLARAQINLPPLSADQFQVPEGPPQPRSGAAPSPATSARAMEGDSTQPARPSGAALASAVSGRLSLAPALRARVAPSDTVYLFARVPAGPRMPLAVLKAAAGQLPLDFQLTDAQAMSTQFNLSSVKEVRVEARITKSGSATPSSGDLFGASAVVKPGAHGVEVVIDQIQP